MAKLRITQVISTNGETRRQIANLRCLGMLEKVRHLVKVEEID